MLPLLLLLLPPLLLAAYAVAAPTRPAQRPRMVAAHTLYNLSLPRGAMSAAQLGPYAVAFAGGGVSGQPKGSPPSNAVAIFNFTTKRWGSAHLPHARAGSSTSGGWLAESGVAFFGSGGGDSGSVDLLRAEDLVWLPSLRTKLVHEFTACAGTRSTIVCAGGQGHNKSDRTVPFATDVWTLSVDGRAVSHNSQHKLSVPRKKLSAAAAGGIIGFGMGYDDELPKGHGYSAAYDLFNTSSSTWRAGTLPSGVGRQYGTAVGCGGLLLFAGGQIGGGRSATVDIFDTADGGRWLPPANLTVARSNLAAACTSDRFAVIAGGQIPGRNTVDVFDCVRRTWGTLEPLNFGRGWLVGAGAENCVAFASGSGRGNASSVDEYCF